MSVLCMRGRRVRVYRALVLLVSGAVAALTLSTAGPASADTALYRTAQWTATPPQQGQVPQYRFAATGPCPYGSASVGGVDTGCGAAPEVVFCAGSGSQFSEATVSDVVDSSSGGELTLSFTARCTAGDKLWSAEVVGAFDQQLGQHGD